MTPSAPQKLSPLVAIVGPTAIGKTRLAVELAGHLPVEVVSADSRQVYRRMDIATAKPTAEEQRAVPHHLVDIIDPDEPFTLAIYQRMAYAAIEDVIRRGRWPLLVGGTGQYVRAVLEGWSIPEVPPDEELRAALYARAETEGSQALHDELRLIDPDAAERIDHRNVRRVIRALEVHEKTGKAISVLQRRVPPPYRILRVGLTMPRQALYERADLRVDRMVEAGLVREVQELLERGYSRDLPSMSSLGYGEFCRHLAGEIGLPEAIRLLKSNTRKFIRHQYNWFHPNDARIVWFDMSETGQGTVADRIASFL